MMNMKRLVLINLVAPLLIAGTSFAADVVIITDSRHPVRTMGGEQLIELFDATATALSGFGEYRELRAMAARLVAERRRATQLNHMLGAVRLQLRSSGVKRRGDRRFGICPEHVGRRRDP